MSKYVHTGSNVQRFFTIIVIMTVLNFTNVKLKQSPGLEMNKIGYIYNAKHTFYIHNYIFYNNT